MAHIKGMDLAQSLFVCIADGSFPAVCLMAAAHCHERRQLALMLGRVHEYNFYEEHELLLESMADMSQRVAHSLSMGQKKDSQRKD